MLLYPFGHEGRDNVYGKHEARERVHGKNGYALQKLSCYRPKVAAIKQQISK
jgi:hypothetical protein